MMPKATSASPSKNSKKSSKDKKKGSKTSSPSPARSTRAKTARTGNRSTTSSGSLEGKPTNHTDTNTDTDILSIFDTTLSGFDLQTQSKGLKPVLDGSLEPSLGSISRNPLAPYVGQGLGNAEFNLKAIRSSFDLSSSFEIPCAQARNGYLSPRGKEEIPKTRPIFQLTSPPSPQNEKEQDDFWSVLRQIRAGTKTTEVSIKSKSTPDPASLKERPGLLSNPHPLEGGRKGARSGLALAAPLSDKPYGLESFSGGMGPEYGQQSSGPFGLLPLPRSWSDADEFSNPGLSDSLKPLSSLAAKTPSVPDRQNDSLEDFRIPKNPRTSLEIRTASVLEDFHRPKPIFSLFRPRKLSLIQSRNLRNLLLRFVKS